MELKTYLYILWRRKWLVILITAFVVAGAYLYTSFITPTYVSTTTLRVVTIGSDGFGGRPDPAYTQLLMSTYAAIATGETARTEITRDLDLRERPSTSVTLVRNTELMRIQVEATDPAVARDVADATAQIVIRESREQYSGDGQSMLDILSRQVSQVEAELKSARENYDELLKNVAKGDTAERDAARQSIDLKERTYAGLLDQYETARVNEAVRANAVYVVEPANLSNNPATPKLDINLLLGFLVGLFLSIGLAFLVENLDTRLYSNDQIEAVTHAPVLGEIPRAKDKLQIAYSGNGHTMQSEAFRRLRVNVLAPRTDDRVQTILVTSAKDGEGKSTVAGNLGVTMAQSGRRVILIDCNIHQPSIHQLFSLSNEVGLTDMLAGQISIAGVIQETKIPRLSVISSGSNVLTNANSNGNHAIMPMGLVERLSQGAELLGSPTMDKILTQLRDAYDIIILDSPALMDITDAMVLAPLVDEIVLVVSRKQAQRDELRLAQKQLDNVGAKSIGVVVN